MLKRQYRLKNKKAFDATYRNKKIISSPLLTIYLGKEKKDIQQPTKFGFVVSKKYHKRAVKRNRIKRLMREVCRLAIKNNNIENLNKYMSCILIPKESSIGKHYNDILESFSNLIKKIK